MYQPLFNSVLVEIDDKDAEWGSGNDESMLGKSYSKGKVVKVGDLVATQTYPLVTSELDMLNSQYIKELPGKHIMWNEGAEAGTTFEEDGKLYGMIYWYDIRAVKE
jgi:hypothetical protein